MKWIGEVLVLVKPIWEGEDGEEPALGIEAALVTLNSELNEASSFSIRVDGMTGEEDRVLTLSWLQLFEERQKGTVKESGTLCFWFGKIS